MPNKHKKKSHNDTAYIPYSRPGKKGKIDLRFENGDTNRIDLLLFNEMITLPCYDKISYLDCSCCDFQKLFKLPKSLNTLICNTNELIELPDIPDTVETLICHTNKLTQLPKLPHNLKQLI